MDEDGRQTEGNHHGEEPKNDYEVRRKYTVVYAIQIEKLMRVGFCSEEIQNLSIMQWEAFTRVADINQIDSYKRSMSAPRSVNAKHNVFQREQNRLQRMIDRIMLDRHQSDAENAEEHMADQLPTNANKVTPTSDKDHSLLGIVPIDIEADREELPERTQLLLRMQDEIKKQQGGEE